METCFNKHELRSNRQILKQIKKNQQKNLSLINILAKRAGIELYMLERLSAVVNNQGFKIFLFILNNGPVTRRKLKVFFPSSTVEHYLPRLESAGVLNHQDYKYWVKHEELQDLRDKI